MMYRRFGRTELAMPIFSCGGMRYQHKWQDVPLKDVPADNQANLERTIRRALEIRINHIETARGYGSSERQLGLVLPSLPRDQMIVQTKIQPEADPAKFVDHFHQSLERLQLDYVDLLGIHGLNVHRELWQTVRPNGCLAAARQLQKEGKVRHVGFSTHGSRCARISCRRRWSGRVTVASTTSICTGTISTSGIGQPLKRPLNVTWACLSSALPTKAECCTNRRRNL
jgi:predicted aldo/keto reductase-like oxidoreductase